MSLGWITVDKSSGTPKVVKKVKTIDDIVQRHLQDLVSKIDSIPNQAKQDYKKRKLISEVYDLFNSLI